MKEEAIKHQTSLSSEKKIEKVVLQYSHNHHVRLNHANGILSWNLGFFHVYEQQRYLISSRRVFIIFGGESAREFTRIFLVVVVSSKEGGRKRFCLSRVHCVERSESRKRFLSARVLRNGIFASGNDCISTIPWSRVRLHAQNVGIWEA